MKLSDLSSLSLTYSDVGATAGALPAGYLHTRESAPIGSGRARFEEAGAAVLAWGMQRGAGFKVQSSTPTAEVGTDVIVTLGVLPAPCRVIYVLDDPDRRGFAYGTLAGHPESGEELFSVRYDPQSDTVYAEVLAFSRAATWLSKLGGPVTRVIQRWATQRYLKAL